MTTAEVREILRMAQHPVSLEKPIGEEEESELGDFVQDEQAESPDEQASLSLRREDIGPGLRTFLRSIRRDLDEEFVTVVVPEELANRSVALEDVLGRPAGELVEQVAEAPGWAEGFALVDRVLAARLADPIPLPTAADHALDPLGWLLDAAAAGLPLTQKGNLARAVVIEAVNRFDWHPLPNPPRGEDDVFELWALRELARDLGAVRRSGRRLLATRTGRTLTADRAALWRAVAGRLGAGQDFRAIVTELALAVLLDGQPHAQATLIERVGAAAAGEGWHDRATGQPPDPEAVRAQWYGLLRTLKVLSLAEEGGDWRARTVTLTPVGQATALQALHARATGARPDPRG